MVEQCGCTLEQCWWISGTVMVEQCGDVEQWNSVSGTAMVD